MEGEGDLVEGNDDECGRGGHKTRHAQRGRPDHLGYRRRVHDRLDAARRCREARGDDEPEHAEEECGRDLVIELDRAVLSGAGEQRKSEAG